ncbi:protein TsetseEP-like isoform X5 [Pseudoliparis swirei]|uniref:protein TsetseEP-like isoform X5 n=1 Tax=Pseudoliparis swirei TaxID=2059687 RepID=UPI0024BE7406|nr:protein TsetseEP-like isoform X5 [Pseudoliparis swirei]
MCNVPELICLVNQRLTAAAGETCGLFEDTAEHEEELTSLKEEHERQRKRLDAMFNPKVRLQRADVQQLLVTKPEVPSEQHDWSSSLDQEDPEPPHIKEDLEDPEPPHIKEDQEDPGPPHIKEEQEDQEDPEPPHIKEDQEDPGPPHIKEELEDPEPPHIKEDQEDPEPPHIKEELEDPEPPHIKEELEDPEPHTLKKTRRTQSPHTLKRNWRTQGPHTLKRNRRNSGSVRKECSFKRWRRLVSSSHLLSSQSPLKKKNI